MATKIKERPLTPTQIRDVLATGREIDGIGKLRVINLLTTGNVRDSRSMLKDIAADRQSESRFRHMAIQGLYQKGGRLLNDDLVEVAQHADEVTAATVAAALGRTGPANQIGLVKELGSITAEHLKSRADFALTLMSHRHGISGNDAQAPTARQMQELEGDGEDMEIRPASTAEAKLALAALKVSPVDIDLTVAKAHHIQCQPNTFVWLWNAELANTDVSRAGKGVAGVLMRRSRFEDRYALSSFGLTSPTRGGARLTIHRADTGKVLYAGRVALDGALQLDARDHPGLAAIDLRAVVDSGRLEVDSAKSARIAKPARVPKLA